MFETQSGKAENAACFQTLLVRVVQFQVQVPGLSSGPRVPSAFSEGTIPVSSNPPRQLLSVCLVEAALEGVLRRNRTASTAPTRLSLGAKAPLTLNVHQKAQHHDIEEAPAALHPWRQHEGASVEAPAQRLVRSGPPGPTLRVLASCLSAWKEGRRLSKRKV